MAYLHYDLIEGPLVLGPIDSEAAAPLLVTLIIGS